jgi:hypothetical protein
VAHPKIKAVRSAVEFHGYGGPIELRASIKRVRADMYEGCTNAVKEEIERIV